VTAANEVLAALREPLEFPVGGLAYLLALSAGAPTRKLENRRLCRGHGPDHAKSQTLNPRIRRQARRLSKLSDSAPALRAEQG
jgi:hypothetical protein